MYVRKFEADSLDEALKSIKRELGPDAIILKTVTNKGLAGAFKKKRVEITAAISEKSYTKKARVDQVLEGDERDKFYSNSSSYISQMIDGHSNNQSEETDRYEAKNPSGYSNLGLNKQVQSVKEFGDKVRNSLDDFLSGGMKIEEQALGQRPEQLKLEEYQKPQFETIGREKEVKIPKYEEVEEVEEIETSRPQRRYADISDRSTLLNDDVIKEQRRKIDELEKKLFELTKSVDRLDKKEPYGVYQLRTTLRSLSIAESTVNDILKKANFELSDKDLQDVDTVFEFGLREMLDRIPTAMPLFSRVDSSESSCLTVLVSENSCGQTSMLYKIGALKENTILIQYQPGKERNFTETIFNLKVEKASTTAEVVSLIRKSMENGLNVIVDYRNNNTEMNDTKKFIDGIRRSFGQVEVLICLSAIHSETYNKKVVNTYENLSDGLVITNLDLCLNYGALFNICEEYPGQPLKFFGTGDVIPEDIESATGERILAGMFKLN